MKNLYTLILCISGLLSVKAQLTQANHAPAAADTYTNYQCDSLAISPGANGANATWNFSSVVVHTNIAVISTAAACTNTDFPAATVSVNVAPYNNTYFYNSTSSLLNFYGGKISVSSGGTNVSALLTYTQPAQYAAYTMNLNSTATSTSSGNVNITSPLATTGTFTGTCNVLLSGSGTLSVGSGTANTYNNVLKMVTSQTLDITTGLGPVKLTQINFEYFSVGTKFPIFTISTATAVTGLGTNTQTFVTSIKPVPTTTTTPPPTTYVAVPDNSPIVVNLNVFPNPAGTYVNFTTENPNAQQVSVFDITGKLVERQYITDGKLRLNTSEYPAGLYIYSVTNRNNQALKTGKLTVSH